MIIKNFNHSLNTKAIVKNRFYKDTPRRYNKESTLIGRITLVRPIKYFITTEFSNYQFNIRAIVLQGAEVHRVCKEDQLSFATGYLRNTRTTRAKSMSVSLGLWYLRIS